jgi:quinone-modifying oxidoreductase subunit QmoA
MTNDKAAPASGSIMVVGGGISGLTTALEAAEVGYEVFLVEKNPYLGGRVAQLNQYFPKLCPPTCGLEINFDGSRTTRESRCSPWRKWKRLTATRRL